MKNNKNQFSQWVNSRGIYITLMMLLLSMFHSPPSKAELIEDLSVMSPKAIGLANAVTADPPGVDSIHFNPAGLVNIRRSQGEIKFASFYMANKYHIGEQRVDSQTQALYESLAGEPYPTDPIANQRGKTGDALLLSPGGNLEEMSMPFAIAGGAAFRPAGADLVLATAAYSPMMVGFTRDESDPGRYDGAEVAFSRITYFSPSLGYRINQHWSVGASIGFSYQGLSLTTDIRSPQVVAALIPVVGRQLTGSGFTLGPYDDIATLSTTMEDNVSTNINLGILWSPAPWLSLGASYRSETRSDLKGEFEMAYSDKFQEMSASLVGVVPLIRGEAVDSGTARMEFTTPQHLAMGLSLWLTPSWKLNLDVQKSFYKTWDKFEVDFDQSVDFLVIGSYIDRDADPDAIRLQRNYQNALSWSIGTAYRLSDRYLVRMGYQRRNSAIPGSAMDLALPLAKADFYGLGVAINLPEDSSLELSAGYLTSTYDIDYGQSENANSNDPFNLIYNPYVFLSLESKTSTVLLAFSYSRPF